MKRALTKLSALCLICLMLFAACGQNVPAVPGGPAKDDKVIGNGGLTVVKGDYVFYINGTASTADDNKYGVPVKGTIVRQSLTNPDDIVVVVKKVVLSSYQKGGFYIFDDKIYFASPSREKDYDGNMLTNSLDFFSVNLDGTGLTNIKFVASNSAAYKFYQAQDGKVHLVNVVGSEVFSLNVATKKEAKIADNISGTPVLADDGFVYYTQTLYNEEEGEDKETLPYVAFKRANVFTAEQGDITFADGTPIINSVIPMGEEQSEPTYTISLLDVKTFDGKTVLYYTRQSVVVETNPIIINTPYTVSFTMGETHERPVDTGGSDIFTDRYYLSATSYIGADSAKSWMYLVEHEYRIADGTEQQEGESAPLSGWHVKYTATPIMTEKPSRILFTHGDYFFYLNGSSELCKAPYKGDDLPDGEFAEKGEVVIKDVTITASMLPPELITSGDDIYLYFVRSNGYYPSYVYRLLINGDDEDELKAEFVGVATDADKEAAEEMREDDEENDITDKT